MVSSVLQRPLLKMPERNLYVFAIFRAELLLFMVLIVDFLDLFEAFIYFFTRKIAFLKFAVAQFLKS